MAKGQSGLLEKSQEAGEYVTRSRPEPNRCTTATSSQDISGTVTTSRRDAKSSVGWTYGSFDRLPVTSSRGADHVGSDSQGANHSGLEVRSENQRKSS